MSDILNTTQDEQVIDLILEGSRDLEGCFVIAPTDPKLPLYLLMHFGCVPPNSQAGSSYEENVRELLQASDRQVVLFLDNDQLKAFVKHGFFDRIPKNIRGIIITNWGKGSLKGGHYYSEIQEYFPASEYVFGGEELNLSGWGPYREMIDADENNVDDPDSSMELSGCLTSLFNYILETRARLDLALVAGFCGSRFGPVLEHPANFRAKIFELLQKKEMNFSNGAADGN